jgi:hypothetical protein
VNGGRFPRYIKLIAYAQAVYYILTGLWPIIDIHSFMLVTGPKTDTWLVKMVGLLAASIGIYLIRISIADRFSRDTAVLAILSALSFTAIDVVYAAINDRISDIYLIDVIPELTFVTGWALYYASYSGIKR